MFKQFTLIHRPRFFITVRVKSQRYNLYCSNILGLGLIINERKTPSSSFDYITNGFILYVIFFHIEFSITTKNKI